MKLFSCEQVSWGHPDKICDRISDAIIDYCIHNDKNSRCAIETMIKGYNVYIVGELTTSCNIHEEIFNIVKSVLKETLLNEEEYKILLDISEQSPDIALGTNSEVNGAGDQGMMFGYATNETHEMLPLPYVLATSALMVLKHKIVFEGLNEKLGADAKSQVTYDYENNRIDTFLLSTQHSEDTSLEEVREIVKGVMLDVARAYNCNTDFDVLVNPTGRFVLGSSFADSGLTGRKIIADTYGGVGHHGGGAFSGKDPTKVDRSGAYIARNIAKSVVHNKLADKCEVQLAYAIGVPDPVSIYIDCFGTEKVDIGKIEKAVLRTYDLTPQGIIDYLDLKNVNFINTASYGHFTQDFPWETRLAKLVIEE